MSVLYCLYLDIAEMEMGGMSVIYAAFKETLVEYFRNTTLNGFKLLYYIRMNKVQSKIWAVFIFIGISLAAYVVTFSIVDYLENPFETTISPKRQKIWSIPFPAVGVCSSNKISHASILEYAKYISERTSSKIKTENLFIKFQSFGNYFDSDFEYEEGNALQSLLDEYDVDAQGLYNVSAVLRQLAPRCEDLIIKCSWAGNVQRCDKLFTLEATSIGFCCLFNYQTSFEIRKNSSLYYPQGIGYNSGLTILLNTSTKDYFFTDRSTTGFAIQIFRSQNFPDVTTGTFDEVLVSPDEDVNMELSAFSQITSDAARAFSSNRRRCYFNEERTNEFGQAYSRKECLTKCKLRSVLAICGCIPFYAPKDFIGHNMTVVYCTLAHMECLDTHRVTWNIFRPVDEVVPTELEHEFQDALSCPKCLPICSYYSYKYQKLKTSLIETRNLINQKHFMENISDIKDVSLVKIYFSKADVKLFETNVIYKWYQILASIGGTIGICVGCSLISFFELIYFIVFRFYSKWRELHVIGPQIEK